MPLYEYKCDSCGNVLEILQKFADKPLTIHENCGGHLERLISRSALQFKGSGWYVNDYGTGSTKEHKAKADAANGAGKSEKSNGAPAGSESSGKSESSSKSESSGKSESSNKSESSSKSESSGKSGSSSKADSSSTGSKPSAPKSDKK